jgi:single-stranded DNA-binding protein
VEGRLQSRTWERADGARRKTVEVVAERLKALSSKHSEQPAA